jgi:hypothetical protein
MKLVVYADESGTHDNTGTQQGSREAILAGIVAPSEEWRTFCRAWQSALNKYSAPYFNFREWSAASAVARNKRKATRDF